MTGSTRRASDLDTGEIAVLAHALLGATASICGLARALSTGKERLSTSVQTELLDALERQGRWVGDVLGWLARGLPAEALQLAAEPPR